MKKFLVLCLIVLFTACSKKTKAETETELIDLTKLPVNLVYSAICQFNYDLDSYEGKEVKFKCDCYPSYRGDGVSYICEVPDEAGCCKRRFQIYPLDAKNFEITDDTVFYGRIKKFIDEATDEELFRIVDVKAINQ